MQRKHIFTSGEYYHIYSRGNNKQKIFLDDQDRDRFLKILYVYNSHRNINFREDIVRKKIDAWDFDGGAKLVSIGAWVLMSNHFHLYITPKSHLGVDNDEAISRFMQKILTSYSKYFNKKYKRTGGLFEGVFQSIHIKIDEQAKYLFSYIHLNPIKLLDPDWKENGIQNKKQAIDFLSNYKWSSYQDHKGSDRSESKIISIKDFPEYFLDIADFDKELFGWLSFQEESVLDPALSLT